MNSVINELEKIGIVPVIAIEDAKDAVPLARALAEGGLPAAEVTFRTSAAAESIRRMREAVPEMIVGAGTVLTSEQADAAIAAGAQFIVSPGLNPNTVLHCQQKGVPMLPGCSGASDIEKALELGLTEVKFFPAEQLGGLKTIKALAAPYTSVRFMPTGGLNAANLRAYLAEPKIIACGGSFMVKKELISSGSFDKIKELTAQAARLMTALTFRGYITEGERTVTVLSSPNVMRAQYHMQRLGTEFIPGSEKTEKGRLVSVDTADGWRIIAD